MALIPFTEEADQRGPAPGALRHRRRPSRERTYYNRAYDLCLYKRKKIADGWVKGAA